MLHACGNTVILFIYCGVEVIPGIKYRPSSRILMVELFGIQPVNERRTRGWSISSIVRRNGGYSLTDQEPGGLTSQDVEMREGI